MNVLVTRRLTLRRITPLDAEDIALWLSDLDVTRMLARVPFPYHRGDAEEWIAGLDAAAAQRVYTIHRERLIGVVSLEGEIDRPVLGYWLARPWHGHGFMTEAVGKVIEHAFADREVSAIRSSVFVDNPASLRVQHKLGFQVTGGGEMWSAARSQMVPMVVTTRHRSALAGAIAAAA